MAMEKFVVVEVQTTVDGRAMVVPPVAYDSREAADSAYYTALASAAISSLPMHAVSLMNNGGVLLESKCFSRQVEQ